MTGMTTVLADTSAWVEALRTGGTRLPDMTADDAPIGYTQPVLMELLSGCRTQGEGERVQRLVERGTLLPFDIASDFGAAAAIYRSARRRGITPGSHVDCMILAVAWRRGATLLTLDRQQRMIADILGVAQAS